MILVVGLTPAWQQIVELDRFEWGEVLRARAVTACASGKVLNVGIGLRTLGAEVEVISPCGGLFGNCLEADLAVLGVPCRWIRTEAPTRVCTTLLLPPTAEPAAGAPAATEPVSRSADATELVENAHPLSDDDLDRCRRVFAERLPHADLVVFSGSLPRGTPATFCRELLAAAKCPILLDIRGAELQAALPLRPLLTKPNLAELRTTFPALGNSAGPAEGAALLRAAGAQHVFVSAGGEPGSWFDPAGVVRQVRSLRVPVVNPIGCGDSWTAGFAWAWTRGASPEEAVRLATAAAADNARRLLPARLDPDYVTHAARAVELLPPAPAD